MQGNSKRTCLELLASLPKSRTPFAKGLLSRCCGFPCRVGEGQAQAQAPSSTELERESGPGPGSFLPPLAPGPLAPALTGSGVGGRAAGTPDGQPFPKARSAFAPWKAQRGGKGSSCRSVTGRERRSCARERSQGHLTDDTGESVGESAKLPGVARSAGSGSAARHNARRAFGGSWRWHAGDI